MDADSSYDMNGRMWWEVLAEQNPPMAQSNKDRQEALRARRAMLGMTEVRGIYLPPDKHAELKAFARKLAKKQTKQPTDGA